MNGLNGTECQPIEFPSQGVLCRGQLYLPSQAGPRPCVVLAHGLGGTIDTGLKPYAQRFAAAGYVALLFDYRGFGRSDGQPRQVVSVRRQLEDWQAAIAFARSLDRVDSQRVALWGTSFAGGHVVEAAVRDGHVKAICAQCPMMDGVSSSLAVPLYAGLAYSLKLLAHAARDVFASLVGATHLIPLTARPGEIAAMSSVDADAGLRAIRPPDFINAIGARIAVTLASYRPGRAAAKLHCPVLLQVAERDSVAPPKAARWAARRAGSLATVLSYPVGHFDLYVGATFEACVRDQLAFLSRHL